MDKLNELQKTIAFLKKVEDKIKEEQMTEWEEFSDKEQDDIIWNVNELNTNLKF